MSTSRHFLLAPSLARLIQKERGGERVSEGYFPGQPDRTAYVEVDRRGDRLILITNGPDGPVEERAEVPLAHAAALLDVAATVVEYFRIEIAVGSRPVQVRRVIGPGSMDLIAVVFEGAEEAYGFDPPPWFGPEVTAVPDYWTQNIALTGLPEPVEVPLSDMSLMSLLDTLENRAPSARSEGSSGKTTKETPQQRKQPPAAETAAYAPVGQEATIEEAEESLIRELARSLRPQRG